MLDMLMTSIRVYPAVAAMRQAQTMMDNVRSEYTTGMAPLNHRRLTLKSARKSNIVGKVQSYGFDLFV